MELAMRYSDVLDSAILTDANTSLEWLDPFFGLSWAC
jgi:hypothetical protein